MQVDSLVTSTVEGAAEPTPAPEATTAPSVEAESAPASAVSEPVFNYSVGTADSPMYVHVVNAADITAPLIMPLALILFGVAVVAGCHLGKALNWWKW